MSGCFRRGSVMRKQKKSSYAGREQTRIKFFSSKCSKWEEKWELIWSTERWPDAFESMDFYYHDLTKNRHSSEWLFSLGHSSRCVLTIFLLLLCHLFGCWAGLNCRKAPEIFFITSNHPRKCVYGTLYSIVTYKVKVRLMGLMYQIFVFYSLFICFQWKINYFSQDTTWDQAKWYILNDGVILQRRFFFFFYHKEIKFKTDLKTEILKYFFCVLETN